MTTSLARYHARAPRYILDTQDSNLIRLSGAERRSWEENTEIKDISLTGLSFTASADLSPQLGEIIKIQFTVPNSEQMACYAVVIRIEHTSEYENLLGVHFYKLDRLQRLNLVQGLANRIQKYERIDKQTNHSQAIAVVGLILTLICWITLMKIYYL
jgi:c-di-GMP-binding flagellar brake protein YcgR